MATRGFGIDIGGSGIKGCPVDLDAGDLRGRTRPHADPLTLDAGGRRRRGGTRSCRASARSRAPAADRRHLPRRHPARRGPHGRERRQDLDRHRRRGAAARARWGARSGSSTTPTPPATPRRGSGPRKACRAPCSWRRSAPASAAPSSSTACSCRTRSWATSRSTARTPRPARRTAPASATGLTWEQWAQRLTRYFPAIERLLWPDLIVVGGGVSKKARQVPAAAATSGRRSCPRPCERRRHHRRRAARHRARAARRP